MKQHHWIFLAMILGAVFGLFFVDADSSIVWLCDLIGTTIFIGALKMLVAPLIFFSILAGITSLPNESELWDIGWRTFAYYFATTSIAVAIGLFFVLTIQPGHKGPREELRRNWAEDRKQIQTEYAGKEKKVEEAAKDKPADLIQKNLKQIIVNPFNALADGNSLGIIFFAILLGVALILLRQQAEPVVAVITGTNAAIMMITGWVMRLAPVFIFCLVLALAAKQKVAVFEALAWYVMTVLVAIAVHNVVLLVILRTVGKRGIGEFLAGIRRAWALAFSSRSSAATMPVTLDCLENNLKVPKRVTDFVIPIGATVNMDGTALYEGIAIIFLIQLYGGMPGAMIELSPVLTGVIFITAVLASIGAAAIPDAGLITMVLVANAVGLAPEYIGMLFAVDAFLDMFRTSTNVMGDSIGAVVVDRLTLHLPARAPAA